MGNKAEALRHMRDGAEYGGISDQITVVQDILERVRFRLGAQGSDLEPVLKVLGELQGSLLRLMDTAHEAALEEVACQ